MARDPFNIFRFVLFFFCIQFPGSLPRLKFADQNIINASKMKQLYTNRTGDKVCMFSQQYRLFWSSNVANLQVSRKDERINRSYLEHPLAEKMRSGHAYVGIKLMYDRILNAVVTSIFLENLF